MAPSRPTYDLVGFLGSDLGLAVAARNTRDVLTATGRLGTTVAARLPGPDSVVHRLLRGFRRARGGARRRSGEGAGPGSRRVTLFHVNPQEIALLLTERDDALDVSERNVVVPFWELPVLPGGWRPVLSAMDAVMAPTRFVHAACAGAVPPDRLVHYPQAVFLPDGVRPSREAWGLGPTVTAFALAFDFGSDVDRKNPWAAVEAFQAAFPGDERVALVVKTSQAGNPVFSARADELRARIGSDRRIRVVDRHLSFPEILGLYASCDALLSLHRSEGLGLHLMEAMSLGKAVVATNWSGNTDFMTPENSVPIGYRLVPVKTRHPAYVEEEGRPGQVWADADVGEAVRVLRRLHAEREWSTAIGLAAERDMRARRRDVLSGSAFEALEGTLARVPSRGTALARAALRSILAEAAREVSRKGRAIAGRLRPRRPG